ncbi:hypothetical protein [Streptomyces rubiginosohelvolus]|uniref:hypothetical protein n=1 Tax=Streptomyces rubiginosohelvolus TaxID=67362 RepID=UPI0036CB6425
MHDVRLPLHRRHSALRTCLTCFAPYGLRATYHHLTLSAAIPRRLEADPDALVRAVEELHEARMLWLARAEEYAAQRRAEKRSGRRAAANPRPWWLRNWWDGADLPGCPACGDERPPVSNSTGHGWVELCRGCAWVLAPCPCGQRHRVVPETPFNWNGIWRRAHMSDEGTPNPHGPAV